MVPIETSSIHDIEIVFLLLLLFVIVFAFIARKLKTPYPIVLVLAGLALGFIPGIPRITLNPDIVFLLVLPPLLYSAAWNTSWREFRFNLASIAMLAFGLVGFTVAGIAWVAPMVFPGFDWRLGFVLGAVVATTDSIAATSIFQRVGLPSQITDVLEGESLVNDATGLLALEFALSALESGHMPSPLTGAGRLAWLTFGGLGAGLVVALVVNWVERKVEDSAIESVLSILVPYGAYLAAEEVHASGVLGVVACGLYLSRKSAEFFSPRVRIQASMIWESLSFTLNGLTFLLIGLQLPNVRAGIAQYTTRHLLLSGFLFSAFLILIRLIWIFPGAYTAYFLRRKFLHQKVSTPPLRGVFVVGWTGMRGVIALAAALSLPTTLGDGSAFPQRSFLIFLTFSVILVSLVLQGLTLPIVIRLLGLGDPGGNSEEDRARQEILESALEEIDRSREGAAPELAEVYEHLAVHYHERLEELRDEIDQDRDSSSTSSFQYRQLAQNLVAFERQVALRLRREGSISDDTLRLLERELDVNEIRLAPKGG